MNDEYSFVKQLWQNLLLESLRMGEGIAVAITTADLAVSAFNKTFPTTETK
jgi:hypothetical protein